MSFWQRWGMPIIETEVPLNRAQSMKMPESGCEVHVLFPLSLCDARTDPFGGRSALLSNLLHWRNSQRCNAALEYREHCVYLDAPFGAAQCRPGR
jgi:hypothetical protein